MSAWTSATSDVYTIAIADIHNTSGAITSDPTGNIGNEKRKKP